MLLDNTELRFEIEKIKSKRDNQDKNLEIVFRYFDELIEIKSNQPPRTPIVTIRRILISFKPQFDLT